MKARSILAAGVVGLGIAGAASAAATAQRTSRRAIHDFRAWSGSTVEWPAVNGIPARCPAYLNHVELFGAVFPADHDAIAAALGTDALHPVRLPDGRALVFVGGLHYRDITNTAFTGAMAPPYGELMIAALVSRGAAPPMLPLVAGALPLPAAWRAGMFPLAVPVTHRWARDAGWAMGVPKFVADLDFEEDVVAREVRAAEGGRSILRLRVPVCGDARALHEPMLTYTVSEGRLFEVEAPVAAHGRMTLAGRGVELQLDEHPVAEMLRALGLAAQAVGTLTWVAGRLILPDRQEVGSAHPVDRYRGADRWLGRYTIHYPGTAPVDQYGYLTREGIERAIIGGGGSLVADLDRLDAELGAPPRTRRTRVQPRAAVVAAASEPAAAKPRQPVPAT